MPITTNDLEQILVSAIIAAKFAPPEMAASFAAVLAPPVTEAVAELVAGDAELTAPSTAAAPLMTVSDAIQLRNAIAAVISEITPGPDSDNQVAEKLLLAGVIDVPALLHFSHGGPQTGLVPVVTGQTGQHAAVGALPQTGGTPTQAS